MQMNETVSRMLELLFPLSLGVALIKLFEAGTFFVYSGWISVVMPQELGKKVTRFLPSKNILKIISTIDEADHQKANVQFNHAPQEIKRIIELLG